jgi:hypothetical protein
VLAGADFLLLARIVIASIEDFGRLLLEHPDRYPPARIGRTAGELGRLLAGGGTDGHAG